MRLPRSFVRHVMLAGPPVHVSALACAVTACALSVLSTACTGSSSPAPRTAERAVADEEQGNVASKDGVPIHYRAAGSGDVALVFVHCWSCSGEEWEGTMRAFAPRYRVVSLDLAGHGVSGAGRKTWTIRAYGDDVSAVVTKLGLERVVLVGHSMGGPVVLEATRLLRPKVLAIVLVDTLLDAGTKIDPATREKIIGGMRKDFVPTAQRLVRGLFPPNADPALVDRVANGMSSAKPEIAIASLDDLFQYPSDSGLAAAQVPIRAINSDMHPTNIAGNRRYAPDFDATILTGVGHWPMLEAPARFEEALAKTLDGLHLGKKS